MVSQETKLIIGIATVTLGLSGLIVYTISQEDKRKYSDKERQRQHELELEKEKAKLPPEYWNAMAEEHKASVKKHEIDVQSKEKLELDERDRKDAENERIREYEKNAPAEYWEQKRIEQEEKTKRKRMLLNYEAERAMNEQHIKKLEEGAKKIADDFLRRECAINSEYRRLYI